MNEKFPYGYDLNAYIDKAFEQMKADFPWATRDMIAEHTCYGIEKVGDDYQYVRYYSFCSPRVYPSVGQRPRLGTGKSQSREGMHRCGSLQPMQRRLVSGVLSDSEA